MLTTVSGVERHNQRSEIQLTYRPIALQDRPVQLTEEPRIDGDEPPQYPPTAWAGTNSV